MENVHPHLINLTPAEIVEKISGICKSALIGEQSEPYYTYGLATEFACLLDEHQFSHNNKDITKDFKYKESLKQSLGKDYQILKQDIHNILQYKKAFESIHQAIYEVSSLSASENPLKQRLIDKLWLIRTALISDLKNNLPLDQCYLNYHLKQARIPFSLSLNRLYGLFRSFISKCIYGIGFDTAIDRLRCQDFRDMCDTLREGKAYREMVYPTLNVKENVVYHKKNRARVEYITLKYEDDQPRPWIVMFPGASSPMAANANGLRMRDLATSTGCHVMMLNARNISFIPQSINDYTDLAQDVYIAFKDFFKSYSQEETKNILDTITLYGHCGGGMMAQMCAKMCQDKFKVAPKLVLDRTPVSYQIILFNLIGLFIDHFIKIPKSYPKYLKIILSPLVNPIKSILYAITLPVHLVLMGFYLLALTTPFPIALSRLYEKYPTALKRHFSIAPKKAEGLSNHDFLLQDKASFVHARGNSSLESHNTQTKAFFKRWLHHKGVRKFPELYKRLFDLKMYFKESKTIKSKNAKKGVDGHYLMTSHVCTRTNQNLAQLLSRFSKISSAQLLNSPILDADSISPIAWQQALYKEACVLGIDKSDHQKHLTDNKPNEPTLIGLLKRPEL